MKQQEHRNKLGLILFQAGNNIVISNILIQGSILSESKHMNPVSGNSGPPQPLPILLQCNPSLLALGLLLSGLLAPGVDLLRQDLPRFDPGEALFVFPAVKLERLVTALVFRPEGDGPHVLAGAALLVKDPITVFGIRPPLDSKISAAVLAHPQAGLPLHALPEMEVNDAVDAIRVEYIGEGLIVHGLEAQRLALKLEGFCRRLKTVILFEPVIVFCDPLRQRLFFAVHVQCMAEQVNDLPLHYFDISGDVGDALAGKPFAAVLVAIGLQLSKTPAPLQPNQLKIHMNLGQFVQCG